MDQESVRRYIASTFEGVDVTIASKDNGAPEVSWGDTRIARDGTDRISERAE